ncbi:hypothetical protein HYC85_001197 [Camellia sinensis]|uniref:Protein kinase domain-containing protein n=1 Tax=Camellia sinensis TaxID=4442 RepID=A0A7J7I774_CAMSI|nr:hypothetical protein HYC85_001197 [Camellia sinensis]
MLSIALCLYSLLHLLSSTAATTLPYTPSDYFLLNCGSSSNATSQDGRIWDGDATSKFSPSNIGTTSSPFTATEQDPSVSYIPFLTARIFTSKFTYTFPVSSGPKFIRLYFYPATYSNLDRSKSYFSVTAANYTLLINFSAFLTVSALVPQQSSLVKEFILNVRDTQKLDITFNPSPNSYAFINGIEVVSIPNNFYMKGDLNSIPLVGSQQSFYIDNNTALETQYRLNVGGNDVSVNDDTGMYRTWHPDDPYIYGAAYGVAPHRDVPIRYTNETPNYTAPATVYTTARTMGRFPRLNLEYNLTWIFTVDSGFCYLARLHFCEFQLEVTRENERIFSVYMNNQTADQKVDVIHLSGGNGIPVFKDYVLSVPAAVDGLRSKVDLWLAMHPNVDSKPMYADAILNGLEIFKLNQSDGSLAGPNPEYVSALPAPYPKLPGKQNSKTSSSLVYAVAGGLIGGVLLISVIGFFIFRRRRRLRDSGASVVKSSWDFVVGIGGFGYVYKGYIDNGTSTVATKRLKPSSSQGVREFRTEIEMLSKLRHRHVVALIGFCDDNGEMILVYDYMADSTLCDHLYKSDNPPLSWKQRLEICISAALLRGRPAIVDSHLTRRDRKCWREGTVDQIVDPHLTGQIVPNCLMKFGEIFEGCLRDTGIKRPTMGDVIWSLEFALQLQQIVKRNINGGDGLISPSDALLQARKMTTDDEDDMLFLGSQSNGTGTSTAESGARSGNSFSSHQTVVFSQIMNPNGWYISHKPNRINGKKNFLGLEAINPSIGLGCVGMASNTDRFMTYKMYSTCPDDWDLAQKLVVSGCEPVTRRRRGFYRCSDWFDLSRRGWEVPTNKPLSAEFTIDEVLSLKPGKIRIGLNFSPTTGTFAAIMREKNVTVASSTLNLGAPFNEVIALRGLLPLYVSVGSRLPFFDNTLDIVHSTLFLDGWIGIELLQFVLFDWDRVLRPAWTGSFVRRKI